MSWADLLHRPLFIDTSAWVALIDRRDNLHPAARDFWNSCQETRRIFLTSHYVLDEAFTLLHRRRYGLRMAKALHHHLGASRLIEVAEISDDLRAAGWEIFVTYEEQLLSFTDCTSFALMRQRQLLEAFTFDADFHRAGFVIRPTPAT